MCIRDSAVFGQDLQGLAPGGVDRLVLGGRDGEQLREFEPIDDRYVRVLADDTTAFHGQARLSWLDGRCVQGPGTYSPRRG